MENVLCLRTQIFRWHKAFLDGHENMENEFHSGSFAHKKRTKM